MTEPDWIFIRPPSWKTMTEQEQFDWSIAFLRAVLAAWGGEEPEPED